MTEGDLSVLRRLMLAESWTGTPGGKESAAALRKALKFIEDRTCCHLCHSSVPLGASGDQVVSCENCPGPEELEADLKRLAEDPADD